MKLFTVKNGDTCMDSRSCFRTSFLSQPVDVSQRPREYPKTNFCSTSPLVYFRQCWKMSPLVRFSISGLYVKPLARNAMYPHRNSHHNTGKYSKQFKCTYPKKEKFSRKVLVGF